MLNFTCPLCFTIRKFSCFTKLFRHIGRYHRNDVCFRITCNLSASCGSSYRTYAGYKAHLYRKHTDMNQLTTTSSVQYYPNSLEDVVQEDADDDDGVEFSFDSSTYDIGKSSCEISLIEIQRFYLRFLLQLREEHLLPRKIISNISTNIIMLLESLKKLILHRSMSSSSTSSTSSTSAESDRIDDRKFIITR